MSEFIKLGCVADIYLSNIDKKSKDNEQKIKLCNFVDVYYNWAINHDVSENFLEATANENQIKKFMLKKGQVAITKDSETRYDIGVSTYIADDFQDTLLGYHCALIKPEQDRLNGKYLNAYLHSPTAIKHFSNQAGGSGQRYTLTQDIIASLPIPIVDYEKQKLIGNFFSYIDRRILLNNKIISELESMAKTIYNYWFLQFDFPDENGKPYKSSGGKMVWNEELQREIPEGWEVHELGTLFVYNRGVSYNSDTIKGTGIPMINLASFTPNGEYNHKGLKWYSGEYSDEKLLKPFDLVMCNTQQTAIDFSKDIIGRAMLIPDLFDSNIVASHHVTSIKVYDENVKFFLLYLFNSNHFHKYITGFVNGTNIMGLIFDGVEKYSSEIPPEGLLKQFAAIVLESEKMKSLIIRENQELASLRDFLLPMLMNGQVTFKESK